MVITHDVVPGGTICSAYDSLDGCSDESHWVASIDARIVPFTETASALLPIAKPASAPGSRLDNGAVKSNLELVIRADGAAPLGIVLKALSAAHACGVWKVALSPVTSVQAETGEIRVRLEWNNKSGAVARRVGRERFDCDSDLQQFLLSTKTDRAKAGEDDIKVVVDADPNVPWLYCARMLESCKRVGLEQVEFDHVPDHELPR